MYLYVYIYIFVYWDPLCPLYLRLWWGGVPLAGTIFWVTGTINIWLELYLRMANILRKTYRTILMFALKNGENYKDFCPKNGKNYITFGQLLVTNNLVLASTHSETQSLQHEDNPKHIFFNPTCNSLSLTSCQQRISFLLRLDGTKCDHTMFWYPHHANRKVSFDP